MPRPSLSGRPRSTYVISGLAFAMLASLTITNANAVPSPSPTAANTSCAPAAGVTPTTVNWAMFVPKTGPSAPTFVGTEAAVRLRVAQENAKGGVNGRKIVLTAYDDQASASTQSVAATKAIEQDNNFGIVLSSSTEAMMPYLKAKNIPVIGFNAVASSTDRNVIGALGVIGSPYYTTADYERAKAVGASKYAVLTHVSASSGVVGNIFAKIAPVGGMGMVLRIADIPVGTHDATSTALRVRASGADAVWTGMTVDGGISIAQALKAQGVRDQIKALVISAIVDPVVVDKSNGALEGVIGTTVGNIPLTLTGVPAVRTYVNGMKAAGLNPYATIAPIGYIEADLMIQGLKAAGKCPTRDGFIDAIRAGKVKDFTGGGLIPEKINFTPGLLPNGTPAKCKWYQTVTNGKLVPDKAATCGKLVDSNTLQVMG
ncbi:MAG: ABC transporter substrate-binding protein [Actinomycetota bacterium]|nr:ABC transporter substrate-binding protein [Actinomycetota bacterium]